MLVHAPRCPFRSCSCLDADSFLPVRVTVSLFVLELRLPQILAFPLFLGMLSDILVEQLFDSVGHPDPYLEGICIDLLIQHQNNWSINWLVDRSANPATREADGYPMQSQPSSGNVRAMARDLAHHVTMVALTTTHPLLSPVSRVPMTNYAFIFEPKIST